MRTRWMGIVIGVIFGCLAHGGEVAAADQQKALAYGFLGAGGVSGGLKSSNINVGGGAELNVLQGLTIGAEYGAIIFTQEGAEGVSILSVNGGYHFFKPGSVQKVVPFVSGGYSAGIGNGATSSGANFGGGITYWVGDKLGLRFEFRDHVFSSDNPHWYVFRVGLVGRWRSTD